MNLGLQHPQMLLLCLPWLFFWWWFAKHQQQSWSWIQKNVSSRFRAALTSHSQKSLRLHLCILLLMGLLLILTAAQPVQRGAGEVWTEGGRVLLLFDGSASMYASDVDQEWAGTRFEVAREIAKSFVHRLRDHHFAIASFSGIATFHLPMTDDRELLKEAVRTVEVHTFYQNSGSSFANALDATLRLAHESKEPFQVVILSDGEQPFPEAYDEPLKALAQLDIPIHGLTIGSEEGQTRLIYDQRDIVAGKPKEERKLLREYGTRRVDEHLQRISEATGGSFGVASRSTVSQMVEVLRDRPQRIRDDQADADLSPIPLGLFLLLFLALLQWPKHRPPNALFDVERLGNSPVPTTPRGLSRKGSLTNGLSTNRLSTSGLLLLLFSCSPDDPTLLAHRANELGIVSDQGGLHRQAQKAYHRSLGFQVKPHIPAYNLARSATLQDDYSTAHQLYQEALEIEPRLTEAYYNDGIVLFRWGQAERDPKGCHLERTLDFFQQAHRRFETALELVDLETEFAAQIQTNLDATGQAIREVEGMIVDPPSACRQGGSSSEQQDQNEDQPNQQEQNQNQQEQNQNQQEQNQNQNQEDQNQQEQNQNQNQEDQNQQEQNQNQNQQEQTQQSQNPQEQGRREQNSTQEDQPGQNQPEPGQQGPPQESSAGAQDQPLDGPAPADQPLTEEEKERIGNALTRIRHQRKEEGKFHRRTLPEQFAKETWENPDPEIWW